MTDTDFAQLIRQLPNLTDKQLDQLSGIIDRMLLAAIMAAENEGQYDKHCC